MPKNGDHLTLDGFQDLLRARLHNAQSLEVAAQDLTTLFFDHFGESVVLVRSFVTIPFHLLPATRRQFAQSLAQQNGVENRLHDQSLVLTLMGTRGIQPAWNESHLSQGHIGIPLISASFVESIPMIARLMKELEIDSEWFNTQDMSFVERKQAAGWVSIFYIEDAVTAIDHQGRHIIPAKDFVQENHVETVFGLGGIYSDGTIFVTLVFARERIGKSVVEQYIPLITSFRVMTIPLIKSQQFF